MRATTPYTNPAMQAPLRVHLEQAAAVCEDNYPCANPAMQTPIRAQCSNTRRPVACQWPANSPARTRYGLNWCSGTTGLGSTRIMF